MITFDLVNRYSSEFLSSDWKEKVKENSSKEIKRVIFQGNLLCKNIIIYNDPMDMESTAIPYLFNGVDWNKIANGDPEWTYMLNRHGFMVDLAMAYQITGEEKYLEKWKEYLFGFIHYNGVPNEDNKISWRNIDTGIRLSNWMRSLIYFGDDLKLSNEELKIFEESLKIHLDYLYHSYKLKHLLSNWGVLVITGVLAVSILFPEIVKEEYVKWAWKQLNDQIDLQFYQDGIQWEQSPLYHHEVVLSITYILMHAEYTDTILSINLREKLHPLVEAAQFFIRPNGKLVALHDTDSVDFSYVYSIYNCLGLSSKKPSESEEGILFVGNKYDGTFNYKENNKNINIHGCFNQIDSGFLAYKDENNLITMFNGRHGSSHGHASLGSVTLTLNNSDLLGDPGRFTYQEYSPIRSGLKSQGMHNTVVVDDEAGFKINGSWGYDKIEDPIGNNYKRKGNYTTLESMWSGKIKSVASAETINKQEELYTIKRTVFAETEMNIVIVFTAIDYPGEHKWRSNYNIEPSAHCNIDGDNTIIESNNKTFIAEVLEGEHFKIVKSIFSNKYNQLCNNDKLISTSTFIDRGVQVEAFYEGDVLNIRSIETHQNGKNIPSEKDKMLGFEITNKKTNKKFTIYYCAYDTFKGDKIYLSENNHAIYGKLTIFDENNRRIKLL